MSRVRILFLGTPEFALVSLKGLYEDEHFEIIGVVTQPDRPKGRKLELSPCPVKKFALEKGLKVYSPEKITQELVLQEIKTLNAEVAVVVAYGQILSQKFLDLFPLGAVNLHGSLLPRWRGAAPIQRAIQAGDQETGICLQKIVKELDAGDLIGVRRVPIGPNATTSELYHELANAGVELLHVEFMDYLRGNLAPTRQAQGGLSYAKKINKEESELSWVQTAASIHNKVRAFNLGPGTWLHFRGKKLKIIKTRLGTSSASKNPALVGKIVKISDESIEVATGLGSLELLIVQPESRNKMEVKEFLKGYPLKEGDYFG